MSDCTNCKYATWDYEEYYGGYRQRFVDGCRKDANPDADECELFDDSEEDDGK